MKRERINLLSQILNGFNFYTCSNIEDFIESKNNVKHGRNGILTEIEGNYGLSTKIKDISNSFKIVKINEEEIIVEGIKILSITGTLEKFPYTNKGLELDISKEILLKTNLGLTEVNKKIITDPFIYYNNRMENSGTLVKFNTNSGIGRKKDEEKEKSPILKYVFEISR